MRGPGRAATLLGWAAVLAGLVALGVHVGWGVTAPDGTTDFTPTNAVTAVAFGICGALVLRARAGHQVGRVLLAIAVGHAVTGLGRELGLLLVSHDATDAGGWLLWLGSWSWAVSLWFPLLLLLLPDGRPAGPRWRWPVGIAVLVPVPLALVVALSPGPLLLEPLSGHDVPDNPVGGIDLSPLEALSLLSFVLLAILAIAALTARYRRGGTARQQLKWVLLSAALLVLAVPIDIALPAVAPFIAPVVLVAFSATVGIAVVRHRLLDVDLVINRTLTYAALTAVLAAVYVVAVTLLTEAVRDRAGILPGLVASGLVAAVAAPLRSSLQRGVDRLFYGFRDDPYGVLRRVGEALETSSSEGLLEGLGSTIASSLRLPSALVLLEAPLEIADDVVTVPLILAGEQVGVLLLTPRGPGERLSPADERLLADLARQAAAATHGVRLMSALQAARSSLVTGREEERRRLRRDLHDGMGPLLAAATVQLDAARRLTDDARVASVLTEVKSAVQEAMGDVRRLVDDLRPPALDELGLVAALRSTAERLCTDGPALVVHGSLDLKLPAAVEVAAIRIASEAVSNAVRHAHANVVQVNVDVVADELIVRVVDDGRGVHAPRPGGVGLSSMAERAAELGGMTTVQSGEGGIGTIVTAVLPLRLVVST